MALTGTYIHKEIVPSETEFQELTVTYPEELPEDSPEYEKRGTTETIQVPLPEEKETIFEDIYLIVRAASLHQRVGDDGVKSNYVSMLVSIYDNENHKNTDFMNDTFHDVLDEVVEDVSTIKDYDSVIAWSYNMLKSKEEYSNLIDA